MGGEARAAGWDGAFQTLSAYLTPADQQLLARLPAFLAQLNWPADPSYPPPPPADPVTLAGIMANLRLDGASVAAGALILPMRLNLVDADAIEETFGSDVAFLANGVFRIACLGGQTPRDDSQLENLRKMILALSQDIRVILTRLALTLQALRAAVARPTSGGVDLAAESLDLFAPIAHRLGVYWVKSEVEDLAFQLLWPSEYAQMKNLVTQRRLGGANVVGKVVRILQRKLAEHSVVGRVKGREKHLYSVWTKIQRKQTDLEEMYDLIAYRIIVRSQEDCYRALGMIHSEFKPIPGRFKDYIALPKRNGYQSLHTVVFGPFGNRIEIQIRTEQMHQVAESGVAAHWSYKGAGGELAENDPGRGRATGYAWLKDQLERHQSGQGPSSFLEQIKVDLFPDEIYVFTPQGKIITLPKNATPVDFAYAVHSQVGDHCQGARINGRMAPLKSTLQTGDRVEVITSRERNPNSGWLNFVVTPRARQRITRWLKLQQRDQDTNLGRELLEREARKAGQGVSVNDKQLQRVINCFHAESPEDLTYMVGAGMISPTAVVARMCPEYADKLQRDKKPPESISKPRGGAARSGVRRKKDELQLTGALEGLAVSAARCCGPVPGDEIVGVISTGRGIILHRVDCGNLKALADRPERWLGDIAWNESLDGSFTSRIQALAHNRRGVLTPISQAITECDGNLLDVHFQDRERDPCVILLEVEVTGQKQLDKVIAALRHLDGVQGVSRLRSG
ncbi:putative (p)ppGpp synthetase I SpoT/RelA [Magnetofaba australis IT-1]|uniref:Putative (P)ppGpp synthetase I SpoT/RelA n=2 Tax=Magnetofaba TaxID=1472292 RepID=A0A1Y2K0F0_9PROT|nr:putative (p)ppGpp synthetase I SpoT/RelA [Magnetofaba australis IT-1]